MKDEITSKISDQQWKRGDSMRVVHMTKWLRKIEGKKQTETRLKTKAAELEAALSQKINMQQVKNYTKHMMLKGSKFILAVIVKNRLYLTVN